MERGIYNLLKKYAEVFPLAHQIFKVIFKNKLEQPYCLEAFPVVSIPDINCAICITGFPVMRYHLSGSQKEESKGGARKRPL